MKKWLMSLAGFTVAAAVTAGVALALTGNGGATPEQELADAPGPGIAVGEPHPATPKPPVISGGPSKGRTGTNDVDVPASPMIEVRAPIDEVEVLVRESFPPQYAVRIVSGLPNGCVRFGQLAWERDGDTIQVDVFNKQPASKDVICTELYGMVENVIDLGSDFESGTTYTVVVNKVTETFVAQ